MANVFFVSGSTTFGSQFSTGTPAGYIYTQANDTQTALTCLQTSDCEAVFVYCDTPTGTIGNFNVQQFIQLVRNTTGYSTIPIFLVIPSASATEGTNWQRTHGADGYVTWDANNPTGFWTQVREVLGRFNIRAA